MTTILVAAALILALAAMLAALGYAATRWRDR